MEDNKKTVLKSIEEIVQSTIGYDGLFMFKQPLLPRLNEFQYTEEAQRFRAQPKATQEKLLIDQQIKQLNYGFKKILEEYENTTDVRLMLMDDNYERNAFLNLFQTDIFPKLQQVLDL